VAGTEHDHPDHRRHFATFTYVTPILTEITGFGGGAFPLLLVAYGAEIFAGNWVVGRLADRHALPVLLCGLALNGLVLTGFALPAHLSVPAVVCLLGAGLALLGIATLVPDLVCRRMHSSPDAHSFERTG
jgi:predicted MFS family arabinose efflux permease